MVTDIGDKGRGAGLRDAACNPFPDTKARLRPSERGRAIVFERTGGGPEFKPFAGSGQEHDGAVLRS